MRWPPPLTEAAAHADGDGIVTGFSGQTCGRLVENISTLKVFLL